METISKTNKDQKGQILMKKFITRIEIREKAQKVLNFIPPSHFTPKPKITQKLLPILKSQNPISPKFLKNSITPDPLPTSPLPSYLKGKNFSTFQTQFIHSSFPITQFIQIYLPSPKSHLIKSHQY